MILDQEESSCNLDTCTLNSAKTRSLWIPRPPNLLFWSKLWLRCQYRILPVTTVSDGKNKWIYGKNAFGNLSKCANCMHGSRGQACLFLGEPYNWNGLFLNLCSWCLALECPDCRVIDEQTQQISFRVKPDPQSPEYPQVFNRLITSADIELKAVHDGYGLTKGPFPWLALQRVCAKVLLPVLLKEQDHCRQPNLIHRAREILTCAICGKHRHNLGFLVASLTLIGHRYLPGRAIRIVLVLPHMWAGFLHWLCRGYVFSSKHGPSHLLSPLRPVSHCQFYYPGECQMHF